ncbi:XdhC family protein [Wukongibacter sp. M2B1]|uniref:XdhC family protein n=1 Tax=Wukongibacter sp. M2B1 TaxID=3088895 RepID=UPI003D7ADA60
MEYKLLDMISYEVKNNRKAALVTITKVEGSSPRKEGSMMGVREDGTIFGTIGGGKLELVVTKWAEKCMSDCKNQIFHFKLNDEEGSLHMQCGGEVDVFIKVFNPPQKLLIVGGGHIALKIYEFSKMLGFYNVIVEDREEFCNKERFPESDELLIGDIEKILSEYPIGDNCYIVIVTRGHKYDEIALKSVIESDAKYIGMIGSKNKTKYIRDNLIKAEIPKKLIERVYAPIGINLGGETPEEIAFSIMAEIQLVKNMGSLLHLKDIKKTD